MTDVLVARVRKRLVVWRALNRIRRVLRTRVLPIKGINAMAELANAPWSASLDAGKTRMSFIQISQHVYSMNTINAP